MASARSWPARDHTRRKLAEIACTELIYDARNAIGKLVVVRHALRGKPDDDSQAALQPPLFQLDGQA